MIHKKVASVLKIEFDEPGSSPPAWNILEALVSGYGISLIAGLRLQADPVK